VRFPNLSSIEWTAPLAGGEALHLGRGFPRLRNVTTSIVLPAPVAVALTAGWPARKATGWLYRRRSVRKFIEQLTAGTAGPDEASRRSQHFQVMARSMTATRLSAVVASGSDPYGITGTIAALGARQLVDGEPNAVGVISTDRAFGAKSFLQALEPYGVQVKYVEPTERSGARQEMAAAR
jgi:hypothetical protein